MYMFPSVVIKQDSFSKINFIYQKPGRDFRSLLGYCPSFDTRYIAGIQLCAIDKLSRILVLYLTLT